MGLTASKVRRLALVTLDAVKAPGAWACKLPEPLGLSRRLVRSRRQFRPASAAVTGRWAAADLRADTLAHPPTSPAKAQAVARNRHWALPGIRRKLPCSACPIVTTADARIMPGETALSARHNILGKACQA